jgi:predicted deacylase
MIHEISKIQIDDIPIGVVQEYWLHLLNNGIGEPIRLPILVARGKKEGPVLGLTAAIHGDELNGIPVIQQLFEELDVTALCGTVIGCLTTNVPGVLLDQRKFSDGVDLNRIAPGKANGDVSQIYIARVIDRLLSHFQYHIDLHTASNGRINSYYIRADVSNDVAFRMARLQDPEIILNNPAHDGTFRGAATGMGIHSITLELKDPNLFQTDVIGEALQGVRNVMYDLNMLKGNTVFPIKKTILCDASYWIYTDEGGILKVFPTIKQHIIKGEKIAEVRTIFGTVIKEYFAPEDGIVIGKSVNPINQCGSRILHLGIHPRKLGTLTNK